MSNSNVEKVLLALKNNPDILSEVQLAFAKAEAAAGVQLTREEKQQFLSELSTLYSKEADVIWK